MRIKFTPARITVFLTVAFLTAPLVAVTPILARPDARQIRMRAWAASLVPQLTGAGSTARKMALALISKRLRATPDATAVLVYQYWLGPLMAGGHYRTVARLARQGVLAVPANPGALDHLLIFRIQALAALGREHAALRNAKSLFDVCPLWGTATALVILEQRLYAVYWHDPGVVQQFRREELSGAAIPADRHEPVTRSGVLASIRVNAKPYLDRLQRVGGHGTRAWMEKGDLLLLADKPREAIKYFREVAAMARNQRDFLFDENNVGRAIKAEDGTIGRANAHLIAVVREMPR